MKYNKQNRNIAKNSNNVSSSKLLQALQKMIRNEGGSISYIFVTEKYQRKNFINKKGKKDFLLEPVQTKYILHTRIGLEALQGEKPNTLKTPEELVKMFQATKSDLGADYFIID